MMKPKAISLFCGAGGCSLGFELAGYDVIYASDFDKAAIDTYQLNFPETLSEVQDIITQDFKSLMTRLSIKQGELDILIGGPPCQGFSTAGTRFWDDPRNQLLKEYVRCLDEIRPKWFLMENVEGLLTSNKGNYVYEAAKAFRDLGYTIRIDKVYSQEYGIPQRRKRVIITGNRIGLDFESPKPTSFTTGRIFKNSEFTLNDAFVNLPKASESSIESIPYSSSINSSLFDYYRNPNGTISDHFSKPIQGVNLKRIEALKQGQTMKDLPESLQHESFKKRSKRRVMDGTPSEKRGGAPSGLKRLLLNQPSLTITSAATREFIHPTENRPLTIRECARIQTFPDHFHFKGTQSQKIKQIGNAIPPLLAKVFGEHIASQGFDEPKKVMNKGKLIAYNLTKANAMSPALEKTSALLFELTESQPEQLKIF
ncbi:MAG: DNA cytosine methyltransferase [Allomuricauda sp.]